MNSQKSNAENLFQKRLYAIKEYPLVWNRLISDWSSAQTGDHVWLSYAANYFFSTGGVHWALDPFSMSSRVPGIRPPDFMTDLHSLEIVVLSHTHNDHLDIQLISSIVDLPIFWVIPDHMVDYLLSKVPSLASKINVVSNGTTISYKNITFSVFDSLHFHGSLGVPESGYLVEFDQKRWLFPGDIRKYDSGKLPAFNRLTGCFSHLWLGKARALDKTPPLLDDFCRFFASFDTPRVVISHLSEYGRDEHDLWDDSHYNLVKSQLQLYAPHSSIEKAVMGNCISL